jgi:glucokinase
MTQPAVLGIDIGGTKISLCVTDPAGDVLASRRIPTCSEDGAGAVIERFTAEACSLIEEVRGRRSVEVRGVGIVTPGVVHSDGVKLAPNNVGWDETPLVARVQDGIGLGAVEADNDAKAAAAAEARWGALAGVSDGLMLNLGTGFSAAAIAGGSLLRGAHGAALEIAYQVAWDGPLQGFAEGRAPLEEVFSGAGLQRAASALLGRPTGTGAVFDAVAAVRKEGRHAVDADTVRLAQLGERALRTAARAVANLAIALDPEVIAVSGGMLRSARVIMPALEDALGRLVPFPPRLLMTHFGDHAPLAGACLLGYRAAALTPPNDLKIGGDPPPSAGAGGER